MNTFLIIMALACIGFIIEVGIGRILDKMDDIHESVNKIRGE